MLVLKRPGAQMKLASGRYADCSLHQAACHSWRSLRLPAIHAGCLRPLDCSQLMILLLKLTSDQLRQCPHVSF